ncbi:MAG: MOSC N-terminal beta barrel domain-containing protein [Acidimicrobiaceae bacterium]|nr:MOSC N-terminal beta barrel domain-containing protein [Acidimicrobiaceae bacterium]
MTLTVGALWRYPVKTLAGERLDVAEVTTNGIVGDRVVHVRGPRACARRDVTTTCSVFTPPSAPRANHSSTANHGHQKMCSIASVPPPGKTRSSLATTVLSASTSSRCSSPPTARSPRSVAMSAGCDRTSSSTASRELKSSVGLVRSSTSVTWSSRSILVAAAAR